MIESEVIIVGGGPAGSTCAWKLKEGGIDAIILDKSNFPRSKLCAGWITPKVVKILDLDLKNYPHSLIRLNRLHFNIKGHRIPVITRQYSIRRYELDAFLLKRAAVPFYRHEVKNIRIEDGRYIVDDAYRGKYLVGAGGTYCPVYRTFFKQVNPRPAGLRITTMEQEFPFKVSDPNCYLWFYEKDLAGYSWYVPKGGGYLNLGIGSKFNALRSRGETIRQHWDLFIRKLENLSLISDNHLNPRGYNYYLRKKAISGHLGNAFLLGDAAGLATIDMGEGIGPAVESGILAARSILSGKEYSLKRVTKYSIINILFPWLK